MASNVLPCKGSLEICIAIYFFFLNNIEQDKKDIIQNKKMISIVSEGFFEKLEMNYSNNYEGIIIIENEELFFEQKNVFWKCFDDHCFALMCSTDENCLMASNFLNILQEFSKPELLESPENFARILDALMPSGQLLYLTQKAAQEIISSQN